MNRDSLKNQWYVMTSRTDPQWGRLTDADLLRIEGRAEELPSALQPRNGVDTQPAGREEQAFLGGFKANSDNAPDRAAGRGD